MHVNWCLFTAFTRVTLQHLSLKLNEDKYNENYKKVQDKNYIFLPSIDLGEKNKLYEVFTLCLSRLKTSCIYFIFDKYVVKWL